MSLEEQKLPLLNEDVKTPIIEYEEEENENISQLEAANQTPKRSYKIWYIIGICLFVIGILVSVSVWAYCVYIPKWIIFKVKNTPPPEVQNFTILEFHDNGLIVSAGALLKSAVDMYPNGVDVLLKGSKWDIETKKQSLGKFFMPDIQLTTGEVTNLNFDLNITSLNDSLIQELKPPFEFLLTRYSDISVMKMFEWKSLPLETFLSLNFSTASIQKKMNFTIRSDDPGAVIPSKLNISFFNPTIIEVKDCLLINFDILYEDVKIADGTVNDFLIKPNDSCSFKLIQQINKKSPKAYLKILKLMGDYMGKNDIQIEIANVNIIETTNQQSVLWLNNLVKEKKFYYNLPKKE